MTALTFRTTTFLLIFLHVFVGFCFVSSSRAEDIATVIDVLSGDTLSVEIQGHSKIVRLIGVDTPASGMVGSPQIIDNKMVDFARRALNFTRTLVPQKSPVTLHYGVERYDQDHRLLAYVINREGLLINEKILEMGYGKLSNNSPSSRYHQRLEQAAARGRALRRGLWGMEGFK